MLRRTVKLTHKLEQFEQVHNQQVETYRQRLSQGERELRETST